MTPPKSNNYLKFDKSRMVNLDYSLSREILRTNRRGAYHCTTIAECNTRKQHGLLVMPVPKLGNTNHVLLSSFDETIIQHGAEFNLGIHKYDEDNYSPMGHKYIREFSCDSVPKIIYRVGGVILSKEKMFSLTSNTIFIRYTLLEAHSPTTIRFKPFLAFRDINELTHENTIANHGYKEVENGISMCMYTGYPELFMQFNKSDIKFEFNPSWYNGIEYVRDMEEDLPYIEDLYVPGYFEMPIKKGESIIFSASDTPAKTTQLVKSFEEGVKSRTPRSSFYNCLKNSAHQFYFRPKEGETYILNNYPWGYVNAREQFMALQGLTLSVGNINVFDEVVETSWPVINAFMEGEYIESPIQGLDDPDVLLWFLRSLSKYFDEYPERFKEKYSFMARKIVEYIWEGKHPRLHLLDNLLLYTDGKDYPASWMDGMQNGKPVVPRTGCLVEINVFWANAMNFCRNLAESYNEIKLAEKLSEYCDTIKESFQDIFVNDAGYLYDYVDGYYTDWHVRPNMLYAIASDFPLLEKRQAKVALEIVTKELLTSKGLRTLSPKSDGFIARYEGTRHEKEYSAFNGVARPWLIAPYLEAYLKVFSRSGLSFLERILGGIEEEMANDCIGSLSEMYDGNMPSRGHGAVSSAIDVAGVLRALSVRSAFEENLEKGELL